jgi:S-DNA-T family DNA segregation ATPase FtsK/SpoIIIE
VSIELSVADVRGALVRSAGTDVAGSGQAATLLLGRVFHEVFADLVGADPNKSGLKVITESGEQAARRAEELLEHTWRQLIAPRLRRQASALQTSSEQVLVLWRATGHLARWLVGVVTELAGQSAYPRGSWPHLAELLRSEVPLGCELREAGWRDSVRLVGIADGVVRIPNTANFCAIELKLGRCAPVIDLGQAALYHLILRRANQPLSKSALALLRFSPELDERVLDADALATAEARLLDLIGALAGVQRGSPESERRKRLASSATAAGSGKGARRSSAAGTGKRAAAEAASDTASSLAGSASAPSADAARRGSGAATAPVVPRAPRSAAAIGAGTSAAVTASGVAHSPEPPLVDPTAARHEEMGKRLIRACREQGVGIELREPALAGPRFLRFNVRLATGMKVDGLKRRTAEIQHRLELRTEPLITQEAGRLFIDVERPDPATVPFEAITSQLPAIEPITGSAKVPVGVDPGGKLHLADLSSSGRSHILAAGTTGSGKSEWLRMMMAGLIASNTPDTLRFVTLDPKLAAFAELERSKFLWKKEAWWIPGADRPASEVFRDLIDEMDRRYELTRTTGADNLRDHVLASGKPLARIVCVCDEYFALISQNKEERREIEGAVALLGAKARAAGIHLVLATQQPSRAVISGIIQSNLPCRVALALQSHIESTMILGTRGAERLTGSGDLLYKDLGDPVRLQAPYLSSAERGRWLGA